MFEDGTESRKAASTGFIRPPVPCVWSFMCSWEIHPAGLEWINLVPSTKWTNETSIFPLRKVRVVQPASWILYRHRHSGMSIFFSTEGVIFVLILRNLFPGMFEETTGDKKDGDVGRDNS